MNYKWPLNTSNFPLLDKIKICYFLLDSKNFWTQSVKVQEFERAMAAFTKFQYAVFVSSGSAANTILAMYLKDKLASSNLKTERNIVILPSTTWQTSCSPWIREGFKPHFIDISLSNFGMDLVQLEEFLVKNHEKVAAVFPTSLLGFNLDYSRLEVLQSQYPYITFYVDQCENNFGHFSNHKSGKLFNRFTSTLSTYMGHEIQSVEGGFLLTNDQTEYEKFLMYRNHGMTRSLDNPTFSNSPALGQANLYKNSNVDPRFDFYLFGNNFRNSDINAFIGALDFKRVLEYISSRRSLYSFYRESLNEDRYLLPTSETESVPFCLPIICKGEFAKKRLNSIKHYCMKNLIETRPILSGFLGYQTAYRGMMDEKDFPNSIFLHNNGIYVGLHTKLKKKQISSLTNYLNQI
jgi:CDP-6-deoxy-D-xylo-4-hexulose-3-dehydrase